MKFKWVFPFVPTYALAYQPPADLTARAVRVVGIVALVAILLGIVQPWKREAVR